MGSSKLHSAEGVFVYMPLYVFYISTVWSLCLYGAVLRWLVCGSGRLPGSS